MGNGGIFGITIPTPPDVIPDEPEPVMVATQKEMADAQVPLVFRDYCAHLYIDFLKCKRSKT